MVIDEVQKVPELLDEVHWLIENTDTTFALCGSSARKVRRGGANLLGGRATRFELHGLTSAEVGLHDHGVGLDSFLTGGVLPRMHTADRPQRLLRSYIADYLREEVAAEALVRNVAVFSAFLDVAALSDTEQVNFSAIARDCGVSSPTIRSYFDILTDTLLGRWLPAYTKRPKRRVVTSPKFYFADVGVVNVLARRNRVERGTDVYGKAFEDWIFHELTAFRSYSEAQFDLRFWRLPSGIEVDFVLGDMDVAIEAKATENVTNRHLKGLREIAVEHPVGRRIVVSLEPRPRTTDDGIEIMPAEQFCHDLHAGGIVVDH